MKKPVAVLTLVKDRRQALLNMLQGLSLNDTGDIEVVIVYMNEEPQELPEMDFPVKEVVCTSSAVLPLAEARNLAFAQTNARHCIFLDVDCIPAPGFITAYLAAFAAKDVLWSGQVRYLAEGFPSSLDPEQLQQFSKPDPIRAALEVIPYEFFWSLNFGCSSALFRKIGGFDEKFRGYGAEDTDFSFTAREQKIRIGVVEAMAYHQPHPSYAPPLNHLQDIITNAKIFYDKWHRWPMEGWLTLFADMGYIAWNDDTIALLKLPTGEEIEACRK